jgi:DTW domain-containing protein YfiP
MAKSAANNSCSLPVLPNTAIKEAPVALLKTTFETEKVKGAANKVRRVAGINVVMAAMWARIKSETYVRRALSFPSRTATVRFPAT